MVEGSGRYRRAYYDSASAFSIADGGVNVANLKTQMSKPAAALKGASNGRVLGSRLNELKNDRPGIPPKLHIGFLYGVMDNGRGRTQAKLLSATRGLTFDVPYYDADVMQPHRGSWNGS
jgi:hypothetical protein